MKSENPDVLVLDPTTSVSTCGCMVPFVEDELVRLSLFPLRVDVDSVLKTLKTANPFRLKSSGSKPQLRHWSVRGGEPTQPESSEARFARLASEWRNATAHLSSTTQMCMHPSYQHIIGMGEAAVPLIVADLQRAPDHWFWALKAITGEDPVPPEHRGRIAAMAVDWIEWARKAGVRA